MRAIGLDIGEKTVGVALSDALRVAAHPLLTISREGNQRDAARIAGLVREHEVKDVVVGWPLELSGKEGRAVRRVRALVGKLAPLLEGVATIHEWDERFSTVGAERVLIEADLSRKRRKKIIDQQAAVYILTGWLAIDSRSA